MTSKYVTKKVKKTIEVEERSMVHTLPPHDEPGDCLNAHDVAQCRTQLPDIMNIFTWSNTIEGHEFWYDVYLRLIRLQTATAAKTKG